MTGNVEGRRVDPRPSRTRAAILSAVEHMMAADGAPVSVAGIAAAAGVSRSSFYSQFASVDEAAVAVLVDVFRAIGTDDAAARSERARSAREIASTAALRLVEHLHSRRDFYRGLLRRSLGDSVRSTLTEEFAREVEISIAASSSPLPVGLQRRDAALFVGGGAVSVLLEWIDSSAEFRTPARMARDLLAMMPEWLVGSPDVNA